MDLPRTLWWALALPGRFRAWCAYHHALDDVWDSLDPFNPCHDEVRRFIIRRRKELPRL